MQVETNITINGRVYQGSVGARMLLVHFIREVAGLTGTKVGCDTSQCGSCTVQIDGTTVKSCTVLAAQGRRLLRHDDRGPGQRRRPSPAAGGVLGQARPPVRILHPRHDNGVDGAVEKESQPLRRGDTGRARRQLLPVHRVPEHRGRRRRGIEDDRRVADDHQDIQLGNPPPRGPAADHGHSDLHRRHPASRHGLRGHTAQPARPRQDHLDRHVSRRSGRRRRRRLHRRRRRPRPDAVRVARPRLRYQAGRPPRGSERGRPVPGRRRRRSGGRLPLRGRGRAGVDRRRLRAASGGHGAGQGAAGRRAPATRGRAEQPGVPLGHGRRRRRRGVRRRGGRRRGAHPPPEADTQRDGAALGRRAVHGGLRRAHALGARHRTRTSPGSSRRWSPESPSTRSG